MRALGLLAVLMFAVPNATHAAQTPVGFCQSWLILGHYMQGGGANPPVDMMRMDYLTDGSITETNIIPADGMIINTDYTIAASLGFNPGNRGYPVPTVFEWIEPDDLVDFNDAALFGNHDNVMTYAWTYANNKTGSHLPCYVGVASDDSIQVVINGQEVGVVSVPRGSGGTNEVQNAWPCVLLPGINLVMVKVFEGGGGHNFRFRFQTDDSLGVQTAGNSISEDDVSFSTYETYAYPEPPAIAVSRTISGAYVPGGAAVPIVLTAVASADGSAQVTENVPAGLTPADVTASAGTVNVAGQTITWDVSLTSGTSATLSYNVSVPGTVCNQTYGFSGTYVTGVWLMNIAGDTNLGQASDGWENDDIPWAGDVDIPAGLTPAGRTDYFVCDDSFTMYGDGGDIWDTADEFHFLYAYVVGDFAIASEVQILPPATNAWCKAGLMLRADLSAGSPYVFVCVTNGGPGAGGTHDACIQWRDAPGGGADWASESVPNNDDCWLQLVRTGNSVAANYDNHEGGSGPLGAPHTAPNIDPTEPNLLGLALTSHNSGVIATARFWGVSIIGNVLTPALWSAARDIQATTFTIGQPIHVVINLDRRSNDPVTVVENLPANWTASDMNPAGNQVGNQVTWTGVTGASVSYNVTPAGTMSRWPEAFSGNVTDHLGIVTPITGDSTVAPGDRVLFQDGVYPDPSYAGCADTYIIMFGTGNPPYGDRNQGGYMYIEEGDWYGIENFWNDERTAPGFDDNKLILIKFDLSSIPRDAVVQDAWLRLYYVYQRRGLGDPPVGQLIDHSTWVHMIQREWGEGTGGGPDGRAALPGEANWMSARMGIEDWETSGCRGLTDIAPPTSYQSQSEQTYGTVTDVWVEYDVTDFVRQWVRLPGANHGMKISQDDFGYGTSGYHFGAYNFASSDHPTPEVRPILSVKYEAVPSMGARHWSLYR